MRTGHNHRRRFSAAALVLAGLAPALASIGCQAMATQPQRQLTVLLVEYLGPEAAASARRLGKELAVKGVPNVFIVEGADQASLCVGRFGSWQDKDADETLKSVRQIRDAAGQYPFAGVMLVPIPEPAPANPWPLQKAKGIFTLHVASWELPGRMAKAQAYAAELRAQGFEAYVHHGPRLSIVTLGSFGPEVYDDPSAVGRPGAKPKIVSPKILELQKKFPSVRLEGDVAPPEARLTAQPIVIPGREPPVAPGQPLPRVLYRVSLALVDTRTGQAEGRLRAAGVAQAPQEVPALVEFLLKQMLDSLTGRGKTARVGVAGVLATDADAARAKADAVALEAIPRALAKVGAGKVTVVGPEGTRQMLDAVGLAPATVLADPRPLKGLQGFDYVVTGSVTSFPTR
jgi:hypothetical protein